MRYLLFAGFFLLTTALSAQEQMSPQYVWAKSGLTMRAEGKSGAAKVLVVPFGAAVQPTGQVGSEMVEVTALKSVAYKVDDRTQKSDPYVMRFFYQEVEYNGTTGYVYSGYLSHLSPLVNGQASNDMYEWLEHHWGEPVKVINDAQVEEYSGYHTIMHYPKGAVMKTEQYEGGGGSVFIFPIGSLNDGFLIAERFLGVSEAVNGNREEIEDELYDMFPELLNVREDGTLHFAGDMSTTTIQVIGGMLIISGFGGC